MLPNALIVERKRMPLTKQGVLSDIDYFIGTLGYRLSSLLDFILIQEEDGTYTAVKNRANGKKSLTADEVSSIMKDYSTELEAQYESILRQYREEEERKAKEASIAFAARGFKPSNPPRQPKPDKPKANKQKAAKRR